MAMCWRTNSVHPVLTDRRRADSRFLSPRVNLHSPNMNDAPTSNADFPTTHWTLVVAAAAPDNDGALSRLYLTYWRPLCAQARRFGIADDDVEDVVQELFGALIAGDSFARASATHGRFRSYLLGALRNSLSHRHARLHTQKRGAGE